MLLNFDILFLILFFLSFFIFFFFFFFHPYVSSLFFSLIFSLPHTYTYPYIYLHSFFDFLFFQFLSSRLQNISPLLPLSCFLFLLYTHTHKFLSLYLTQTNSLSYTYRSPVEKWRSAFYTDQRFTCYVFFFFGYGLISFILLFRFHQANEKDCFCVSNLSIGFCVFVLIVVCFSL